MPKIKRIDPKVETPITVISHEGYGFRLAYSRSADSQSENQTGQDFLVYWEDEKSFGFALCDGVSQSFFGELAAQYLGGQLLNWLAGAGFRAEKHLKDDLTACLQGCVDEASSVVKEYAVPEDLSPLLREVLEEKRELGSESMFVAGRIDLPGDAYPLGRLLIAWMGDSRLRVFHGRTELTPILGNPLDTARRWSTNRGLVNGEVGLRILPLIDESGKGQIDRILAYTDGISSLDKCTGSPGNEELAEMIAAENASPTSDDIALLEIFIENRKVRS